MPHGPLALDDDAAYLAWRADKLACAARRVDDLRVEVADVGALADAERRALMQRCATHNMVLYRSSRPVDREGLRRLGKALGLTRLDGNLCADDDRISAIRVMDSGRQAGYIPYTSRPLSWHTDGYYNPPGRRVRAWLLHCVRPAARGGENALLDPELAYIHLRDRDPALVAALMHPEAMTIPPNREAGEEIRGAQSGPVFSVDPETGHLHMRYTARKRNIVWRDDAATRAAVAALEDLLADGTAHVLRVRLAAGEGIISNNVLHNRSAFEDEPGRGRLLFRARYYDRIPPPGAPTA
jgi:alpha-ketoglutarate-dependent taurine dioxygenase